MNQLNTPLETLAASLHHAALIALPDEEHKRRDFHAAQEYAKTHGKPPAQEIIETIKYRPRAESCQVVAMFPQMWGSTALGFGGIGGAAMTSAYTVVIAGPGGHLAVYWDGQFAYLLDPAQMSDVQRKHWLEDLSGRKTSSRSAAKERYGARVPCRD